ALTPDAIAKRTKRHLDELERSNYAEPSTSFIAGDDDAEGSTNKRGRARETISDKRPLEPGAKRKKSSMNVRTAVLYRKNLATLIDESGIANLPAGTPSYLTAVTDPPAAPPRLLCSV
ncbi:hypothetical protein CONPUDRAFT_19286, partial [Coniophora puteana RWD-64-598 SS2]